LPARPPAVDTVKGVLFLATQLVKAHQHGRQEKNLRVYCEATREQSTLEPSESPFVKRKSEEIGGKAIVTAGTMAAAIGKGVREILDKTDRKQNFDMQKHGVEILVRSTADAGESDEAAESAAGA
jgi:hypothetical protein